MVQYEFSRGAKAARRKSWTGQSKNQLPECGTVRGFRLIQKAARRWMSQNIATLPIVYDGVRRIIDAIRGLHFNERRFTATRLPIAIKESTTPINNNWPASTPMLKK